MSAADLIGSSAEIARTSPQPSGDFINPELIVPRLSADTKIGAIKELIDRLHARGIVCDSLSFLQAVLERENLQSTILDSDVALPHARNRSVNELGMALGIARPPIEFPSGDDCQPIHLICLIAVPAHAPDLYLGLLASLARTFSDGDFRQSLLDSNSAEELHHLLLSSSLLRNID